MKDFSKCWVEQHKPIDLDLENCDFESVWQMPKRGEPLPYKVYLKNLEGEWLEIDGVVWPKEGVDLDAVFDKASEQFLDFLDGRGSQNE